MNDDCRVVIKITIENGKVNIQNLNDNNFTTYEHDKEYIESENQGQIEYQRETEKSEETNQFGPDHNYDLENEYSDNNYENQNQDNFEESIHRDNSRGGRQAVTPHTDKQSPKIFMPLRSPDDKIVDNDGNIAKIGHTYSAAFKVTTHRLYLKYRDLSNSTLEAYRDPGGLIPGIHRYLHDINLSRAAITNLNLSRGHSKNRFNAQNVRFNDSLLEYCTFNFVDFYKATFIRTRLYNVRFINSCSLHAASFEDAILRNTIFDDSVLNNVILDGVNADNISNDYVKNVTFRRCEMSNARLRSGSFKSANFEHAQLIKADLSNSDLTNCHFYKTNLTGSYLRNCKMKGANLKGANFTNCDLRGSDWWKAEHDSTTTWTNSQWDPRPTT